jgi:5S rRNA maturation endonuclease (ribonuclease M5)
MKTEEILDLLDNVKRHGDYWMARCPAHEDGQASLQIGEREDGSTGLYCHAGCVTVDVVEALNIKMADLFSDGEEIARIYDSKGSPKPVVATPSLGEPEDTYVYEDETGSPVFEVLRFPNKQFRQRLPGAEKFGGVREISNRPLFHLPQLLRADTTRRVYIAEGEKDVLSLEAAGCVATCSVGGAGKWDSNYAHHLRSRNVVIVADKDDPGMAHAEDVAKSLEGQAATIRVVQAAEGKDATDHFNAGYTTADFVEVERVRGGIRLLRADMVVPEDVTWVPGLEGFVPFGGITHLGGMPGVNKSTFTCLVASKITMQGHSVIMVSSEDTKSMLVKRLVAAGADLSKVSLHTDHVALPGSAEGLEENMEHLGAKLLVIDPVEAHLEKGIDAHRNQDVRSAFRPLSEMADRLNAVVILVGHPNKTRSADPMMRAGGSIGIPGIARSALLMGVDGFQPETSDRRVLASYKGNWDARPDAQEYLVQSWGDAVKLSFAGTSSHQAWQLLTGHKGQTGDDHEA